MDQLLQRTFTTSRGLSYNYYVSESASSSDKPTIVLCHGFPDSAQLWAGVVAHLISLPFPLLVPDMLGYSGSSKPTNASLYNSRDMTKDIAEILAEEKIEAIISLGHDWGSFMARSIYLWHPDRVVGLILLNVAYRRPSRDKFDLQAVNRSLEESLGSPLYAYWELFTAPDGPEILENHLESFWTVLHGDKENWMGEMFCVRGAMREYLLADKRVPLKPFAQDQSLKEAFMKRMSRDGFRAPLQWYCSMTLNDQFEVEKDIPEERVAVKVPHLFIGCNGDAVCRSEEIHAVKAAGLVPDLTFVELESGHWCPLEKPKEVAQHVRAFLEAKF